MRQPLRLSRAVNRCQVLLPLDSPDGPHPPEKEGKQDLTQWARTGSFGAWIAGASCRYLGAYVWQVCRCDRQLSSLLGSCRFADRQVKIQHRVVREFASGLPCKNIQYQAYRVKDRTVWDKVSETIGQKNTRAPCPRRYSLAWRWPPCRCHNLFSDSVEKLKSKADCGRS